MRIPLRILAVGVALLLPLLAWAFVAFGTSNPVTTSNQPPSDVLTSGQPPADVPIPADGQSVTEPPPTQVTDTPKAIPKVDTPEAIPKVMRKLPQPPPPTDSASPNEKTDKPGITLEDLEGEERPTAEAAVQNAFEPPPTSRSLSKNSSLWIDPKQKRVYADGYVIMNRGMLEMFACPMNTKEHESVVAVLAKSSQVHAALLAVGAIAGTPVRYSPEFLPATGQRIRVWISWFDQDGKYQVADARSWIRQGETTKTMQDDWVFAGSGFWKDEEDGKEYYQADSGDMICVSNFSTAMLDVPVESSAQADSLVYSPYTERIPERGTPIRLTLIPIPVPSDDPADDNNVDAETPPGDDVLTKKIVVETEKSKSN